MAPSFGAHQRQGASRPCGSPDRHGSGDRRHAGARLRLGPALEEAGAPDEPDHGNDAAAAVLDDDAVTVASFEFAESELLAEIYGRGAAGRG